MCLFSDKNCTGGISFVMCVGGEKKVIASLLIE